MAATGRAHARAVARSGVTYGGQQRGATPDPTFATPPVNVIAVIPARGGSRGLPGKNLRRLGGRPLIEFTIEAAVRARHVDRVVVTTESRAIADVANAAGAEVPFLRPANLATDTSPTVDAVAHAVEHLERTSRISTDFVVTLQPTSPFRTGHHLDEAIEAVLRRGADSAVSVSAIGLPASVLGRIESDGTFAPAFPHGDLRRQAAPPAARITGAIYITERGVLADRRLLGDRPLAIVLEGPAALDIDHARDLAAARRILRRWTTA